MPEEGWGAKELRKAGRAVTIVVLHTIVSAVIILCMWLMERLILLLWSGKEPVFLGVELHTIVLGAEVAVLLTFLASATISAARTFWR